VTPPEPFRPGKTARNEDRKLVATSANAIGLAVLAIGGLTPVFTRPLSWQIALQFLLCALAAAIFHTVARRILRKLED
jgi:membrane protein implicated in regulation of membrane protease activity